MVNLKYLKVVNRVDSGVQFIFSIVNEVMLQNDNNVVYKKCKQLTNMKKGESVHYNSIAAVMLYSSK